VKRKFSLENGGEQGEDAGTAPARSSEVMVASKRLVWRLLAVARPRKRECNVKRRWKMTGGQEVDVMRVLVERMVVMGREARDEMKEGVQVGEEEEQEKKRRSKRGRRGMFLNSMHK
jgi:hypothetical protein